MSDNSHTSPPAPGSELDLLMPLHFFLGAHSGFDVAFLAGEDIPEPYRKLLVHESDMTSTLADFHRSNIGLQVCEQVASEDFIMRAVVLEKPGLSGECEPVEFGAIGIQLEPFPEPIREKIRAGEQPLGGILREEKISHSSRSRGFFKIRIDSHLAALLQAPEGSLLFGRCNVLSDAEGIDFADIVEILPALKGEAEAPASEAGSGD